MYMFCFLIIVVCFHLQMKRPRRRSACLFFPMIIGFAFCVVLVFRFNGSKISDISLTVVKSDEEYLQNSENAAKSPLVLAATTFFDSKLFDVFFKAVPNCPHKCNYTEDISLYKIADVAIFHARDFTPAEYLKFSSPNLFNPNRLNIFYSMESGSNQNVLERIWPPYFFNATMTFRRDSTIWLPYDMFEEIDNKTKVEETWTEQEVENVMKNKSELALQFVSNCKTDSRREIYLFKLLRHINVTVYGACSNKSCSDDTCYRTETARHYFYLAFENSVCQDYVTEKFWRLRSLMVPIVLKRSILKDLVDDKYFLAADDFASPRELVEKMKYLVANPEEYKKYFEWTKHYKKVAMKWNGLCQICQMAHNRERHQINDIAEWWNHQSKCIPQFAATSAKKAKSSTVLNVMLKRIICKFPLQLVFSFLGKFFDFYLKC